MNDLTAAELRQYADALDAHAQGERIEYFVADGKYWADGVAVPMEYMRKHSRLLRPKPEPVLEYWSKPEHVPPVCWLRFIDSKGGASLITSVGPYGIVVSNQDTLWKSLTEFEYSTDRNLWKPCTVEAA